MKSKLSDYSLIIVGAGAAGLAASEKATALGIDHLVLESSHRLGGRGLTEMLSDRYSVDLGCHWMHCGSVNPYAKWADKLGHGYVRTEPEYALNFSNQWLTESECRECIAYMDKMYRLMDQAVYEGRDLSIWDTIDQDSRWTPWFLYWVGLLHSNDADQVSILDVVNFHETNENWPLINGYGALICAQGKACQVELNNAVESIDWRSKPVKITTTNGQICADTVLITVSTGILNAGDIQFIPELPKWKQEAINALPMGNSNYIFCSVDSDFPDDKTSKNIGWQLDDQSLAFHIRPFGLPYLFTSTGGRFAWWLEKQGQQASIAMVTDALVSLFGSGVEKHLVDFKVSAWGMDPWIRGAYSSAQPGKGHIRSEMAQPIDRCLYFAGEATSLNQLNTAHGAYSSGHRAVMEISRLLGQVPEDTRKF